MIYSPLTLHLQEGDIITSKKGILQQSILSNKYYLVKKIKYLGSNIFEVIGNKEEVDAKEVKE